MTVRDYCFQSIEFICFGQFFDLIPFDGAQVLLRQLKCSRIYARYSHIATQREHIWIVFVQCVVQIDIQPSIELENRLNIRAKIKKRLYRGIVFDFAIVVRYLRHTLYLWPSKKSLFLITLFPFECDTRDKI